MLQLEQHRHVVHQNPSQSAMVTPQTSHSTPNPITQNDRPQYYQHYDQNRTRDRGRGNQWCGGRGRGRSRGLGKRSTGSQWTGQHWIHHVPAPYGQWQNPQIKVIT